MHVAVLKDFPIKLSYDKYFVELADTPLYNAI